MKTLHHVRNELRLKMFLARRYWLESVAAFLVIVGTFFGLLHVVSAAGGMPLHSERLDGLILGFVLWMFAGAAYSSTSNEIAEEIRSRSLEQLCLGALPLWKILAIRAALNIAIGAFVLILSLTVIESMGREKLHVLEPAIFAIVLLAAPALLGLGYMIAGVLLVMRKVEAVQLLVYPGLIGLVALPAYPLNVLSALPFAYGASAARLATLGYSLSVQDFLLTGVNSLMWLSAGITVFVLFEARARRSGVMGHA